MSKKPLGPRSSGSQLWAEVERLRRAKGDTRRTVSRETFDEQTAELERARARESAALDELGAARMDASDAGIEGESFGGKPSLAKMRKAWGSFADAVNRLPETRRKEGMGQVAVISSKDLMGDLDLFELDAPHGPTAAKMRDLLRRQLTHPAHLAMLASEQPSGVEYRSLFISSVARWFLRPSVWRVYEKGADEGIRDALGTVFK